MLRSVFKYRSVKDVLPFTGWLDYFHHRAPHLARLLDGLLRLRRLSVGIPGDLQPLTSRFPSARCPRPIFIEFRDSPVDPFSSSTISVTGDGSRNAAFSSCFHDKKPTNEIILELFFSAEDLPERVSAALPVELGTPSRTSSGSGA